MRRLLEQWNAGLKRLDAELGRERDRRRMLVPYGDQLECAGWVGAEPLESAPIRRRQ
jgi:hypothetical protein